jgi:rhodanese-related sulfurtransferase
MINYSKKIKWRVVPGLVGAAITLMLLLGYPEAVPAAASPTQQTETGSEDRLRPDISIADAVKLRDRGAFLLDVREPVEWVEFHIPGSTHIPLGELPKRVGEVPRDREVVVVCRTGNRSQKGRDILIKAGFRKVTNMQGGVKQWRSEGHPTVSGR